MHVVKVLNPVPGHASTLRHRKAKAAIRDGFAIWVERDISIRIVQYTEQEMEDVNAWLAQQYGYDRNVENVMSTVKQIRGLPCMQPVQLLTIARVVTPERRPRMKSAVICRNGIECVGAGVAN